MKKTERINTMMRYINNRAHFTLSEIMEEFDISRSTAIRDIREIEAMGLPLVAEVGRSGGYSVIKNAMLPSIHFTDDEVKALFVAFIATKNQQLPFLKSRQTISEKLIGLLSEVQQDDLVLLNEILLFEGTNPLNPDLVDMSDLPHPIFEQLIQMILVDRYLILTVSLGESLKQFPGYILRIYQDSSRWFIEIFDLETFTPRHFAVSHLEKIEFYEEMDVPNENEIDKILKSKELADNIQLRLGPRSLLQYKKYHPYHVKLFYTNPFQLEALCTFHIDVKNNNEIEAITNWLLFLGQDITILELPDEIREQIKNTDLLSRIS